MRNFIKNKWYIAVILFLVFALSIATWFQFFQSIGKEAKKQFSSNNKGIASETVKNDVSVTNKAETGKAETNKAGTSTKALPAKTNKVSKVIKFADKAINYADLSWTVYDNSKFSKFDSLVTYYMVKEIASVQVLGGSGKWLFYKTEVDGNPIADFEGKNAHSESELKRMAEGALKVQNEFEEKGVKFLVFVAPNKENVYAEYMPDNYEQAEKSRTDKLIEYLSDRGVNICSPQKELVANHKDSQLYYYYDTHWNQLGAYIGVREIAGFWGIEMPELSDRVVTSKPLKENSHYCADGDLAKMVGLQSVFDDDLEYEVEGTASMDWQAFKDDQNGEVVSYYHNSEARSLGKILLVGDSFRSSMVPALRETFTDVYICHRSFFSKEVLEEINPNYVVVEYVERYSGVIESIADLFK